MDALLISKIIKNLINFLFTSLTSVCSLIIPAPCRWEMRESNGTARRRFCTKRNSMWSWCSGTREASRSARIWENISSTFRRFSWSKADSLQRPCSCRLKARVLVPAIAAMLKPMLSWWRSQPAWTSTPHLCQRIKFEWNPSFHRRQVPCLNELPRWNLWMVR